MIRLGTRASALALAQAHMIAGILPPPVELVHVTTSGDRGERGGDKARWTRELDAALLDGRIDLAIHSAKDVPGELPDGIEIVAVPERADPRDALVGAPSLDALAEGARVGTSSLRRMALLKAARPDLEVVELRGNVDTRLAKLAGGEADALLLACAGLDRLGRGHAAGCRLPAAHFVPAPGQGSLAVTGVPGSAAAGIAAALDHPPERAALEAERAFAAAVGATCHTPIGVHAGPGGLRCFIGLPDGSAWLRDELPEPDPAALAERVLAAGAGDLLQAADRWTA